MTEEYVSIQVIGAGVARTGTNSLKKAIEILYGEPCYHLKEIYLFHHSHIKKWIEIDENVKNQPSKPIDKDIIHDLFKGYVGAIDHPTCAYFKQLMELYPQAKVILTTRNPEIWLAGCRSTILPRTILEPQPFSFYFLRYLIGLDKLHELFVKNMQYMFGPSVDFSSDTAMLDNFIQWDEHVTKSVPTERLLRFDICQGWEPLCTFLQKPVPNCPFPHVNEYKEVKRLLLLEKRITNTIQWGIPALLMLAFVYLFFRSYVSS